MAKGEKIGNTPEIIQAPRGIAPIMKAFHADTEKNANLLILESAKVIFGKDDNGFDLFRKEDISKEELLAVTSLMKELNPQDSLEMLYSAQIVTSHLLGMRKLAQSSSEDQKLGLKLLRFSNDALLRLEKKQSDVTKNIKVNYNH